MSYCKSWRGKNIYYYKKLFLREISSFKNREKKQVSSYGKENAKKISGLNHFFSLEIKFTYSFNENQIYFLRTLIKAIS